MTASRRCAVPLVALAAALLQPPPAHAEPERLLEAPRPAAEPLADRVEIGVREILSSLDVPETSWLSRHLARVGISRYGLTYTRELAPGAGGMRLRIGGPRLRGSGDLGLSIELRF